MKRYVEKVSVALLAFSNLIKIDRRRSRTQARSRDLACFLRQYWNKAPLLVQTVVVGPLDHIHSPACPTAEDVKYQAAIAVFNLKEVAVRNQAPLLVQTVVVGPLDHIDARTCPDTEDVSYQTTVGVHDHIIATVRNQKPLLIQTVVVGPLDHIGPSVCSPTEDVEYQAAIAIHK